MDDAELARRLRDFASDLERGRRYHEPITAEIINEAATRLSALSGAGGREVEAVARALAKHHASKQFGPDGKWFSPPEIEKYADDFWDDHSGEARAALATLPTAPTAEEMRERCAAVADAYADIARQQGLDDTLIRLAAAVVRSTPTEDTTP